MLTPNQSAAANRRPAGQSDGSDNLPATLAADRAFPAAVAELPSRCCSHPMNKEAILFHERVTHPLLASGTTKQQLLTMTDKQAVLDALDRLPENTSIEEITEELRIMAAIRHGRADIAAGRCQSHEVVGQLIESWATAWTSR